jgi:hypothetical protein
MLAESFMANPRALAGRERPSGVVLVVFAEPCDGFAFERVFFILFR